MKFFNYLALGFLCCFLFVVPTHAQLEHKIDSLKQVIAETTEDTVKAATYFELAKLYTRSSLSQAKEFANEGLIYAKKTNHPKGLIGNLGILGYLYMSFGKYDSAQIYYEERLDYAFQFKDTLQIGATYANMAIMNYRKDDYKQAVELGLKGLKIIEPLGNVLEQARAMSNLANYLEKAGDIERAEYYMKQGLALKEQVNDERGIVRSLAGLGGFYTDQEKYEEAITYLERAEKACLKLGDQFNLSITYANWGLALDGLKKHREAEGYHQKALAISEEINDTEGVGIGLENLGGNLSHQGKNREALAYYLKALAVVRELKYIQNERTLLGAIADVYAKLGEHEKAYQFSVEFNALQDSLNKVHNTEAISEMQTKYETEKKNQQIALLTKENEIKELNIQNQRTFNYALIVFLALITILALVLWNRYKLKQRTSGLLAEKNMELEKLNATKDKLFALIAHDLKNPLSSFRSITQSLNENLIHISKSDLEYFLSSLNQSANSLYDLLQNLLSWAISQINQLPFHTEKIALKTIVEENIALLEANAQSKNIKLTHDIKEADYVFMDKNSLRTVLRNLMGNALKFTPKDGSVSVTSKLVDQRVLIEVHDTGIGISSEDLTKLFKIEEDVSVVGSSKEKGTGLGLILCKELLEKQQGEIYAKSELGKGSTFTIAIPHQANEV
ncbi:MAG: tetratricopeptide repeat protein [Flammeovirgaceae bacterium]